MSTRPSVDRVPSVLARTVLVVAEADITPPVGISSNPWGKSSSALSTGVHRALTATAIALRGERTRFIIGLDIGWIGCHECDVVNFRGRVVRELGIEIDDLLVNLSQTHKGPPFCIHEALREGKEFVPAFIEKTISSVIEICRKAQESAREVDITWGYGKCSLGTVRDLPVGDQIVVGFNPELEPDDTLVVGRVTDRAGKAVATLVNYGCHPTSVGWGSSLISPDYVGKAREIVESATGAPMLFLLGACGNVAPKIQYAADVAVADKNGEILGYSTLATLSGMLPPATEFRFTEVITSGSNLGGWDPVSIEPNSQISSKKVLAKLRHKELLNEEQMRERWAPLTATESFLNFRIRKQFEMRIDYVQGDGTVLHPIWFWRLGDAVVVAHCGEAYLEMARELRRRNPDLMLLFLDMTNGPGYIYVPTQIAYEQNTYQSQQSLLAPGGFEEMLEIIDRELKNF
jgi:hypothetical protein